MVVRAAMAKRGEKKAAAKGSEPSSVRRTIASFKASAEFEAWMHELEAFLRLPTSTMIEHALIELARARKFPKEPPER